MSKIRIKRGTVAQIVSYDNLEEGELLFSTDGAYKELYIGTGTKNLVPTDSLKWWDSERITNEVTNFEDDMLGSSSLPSDRDAIDELYDHIVGVAPLDRDDLNELYLKVLDSAPGNLDSFNKLADSIGNNSNYHTHTHDVSTTTGILPVSSGGTGATNGSTARDATHLNCDVTYAAAGHTHETDMLTYQISSTTNLYIGPSGSDASGDGTSGNPWATISHALEYLSDRRLTSIDVIVYIHMQDGIFYLPTTYLMHPQGDQMVLIGNGFNDIIINFSGCSGFHLNNGHTWREITGIRIKGNIAGSHSAISVNNQSTLYINSDVYIWTWSEGFYVSDNSSVMVNSSVWIRECSQPIYIQNNSNFYGDNTYLYDMHTGGHADIVVSRNSNAYLPRIISTYPGGETVFSANGATVYENSFLYMYDGSFGRNPGWGVYLTEKSSVDFTSAILYDCGSPAGGGGIHAIYDSTIYCGYDGLIQHRTGVGITCQYGSRAYINATTITCRVEDGDCYAAYEALYGSYMMMHAPTIQCVVGVNYTQKVCCYSGSFGILYDVNPARPVLFTQTVPQVSIIFSGGSPDYGNRCSLIVEGP